MFTNQHQPWAFRHFSVTKPCQKSEMVTLKANIILKVQCFHPSPFPSCHEHGENLQLINSLRFHPPIPCSRVYSPPCHHFPLLAQSLGVQCRHVESILIFLFVMALLCPSRISFDRFRMYCPL